jgi:hypothetical protein
MTKFLKKTCLHFAEELNIDLFLRGAPQEAEMNRFQGHPAVPAGAIVRRVLLCVVLAIAVLVPGQRASAATTTYSETTGGVAHVDQLHERGRDSGAVDRRVRDGADRVPADRLQGR